MKATLLKILLAVFYLSCVLAVAGWVICANACNARQHNTSEIAIMLDVTEPLLAWPKADELQQLYKLENDNMNGVRLHVSELNDVSYNRQTPFVLEQGGSALTTNRFDRKHEVEAFLEGIALYFDSITHDTLIGRPKSSLYIPLAMQLNSLSESNAEHRVLVVYSDLLENSSQLNLYDPETLSQLKNKPDTIAARLKRMTALNDLTGIHIYIVFQPRDTASDDTFRSVSGFFKTYFEQHGADVTVTANLNR